MRRSDLGYAVDAVVSHSVLLAYRRQSRPRHRCSECIPHVRPALLDTCVQCRGVRSRSGQSPDWEMARQVPKRSRLGGGWSGLSGLCGGNGMDGMAPSLLTRQLDNAMQSGDIMAAEGQIASLGVRGRPEWYIGGLVYFILFHFYFIFFFFFSFFLCFKRTRTVRLLLTKAESACGC